MLGSKDYSQFYGQRPIDFFFRMQNIGAVVLPATSFVILPSVIAVIGIDPGGNLKTNI